MNEDNLIDKAILYANGKVPRRVIKDCLTKRNKLLAVMPKGNEKLINEYEEAVLKQAAVFYEEAMHYLASLHNVVDSDVLQSVFSLCTV